MKKLFAVVAVVVLAGCSTFGSKSMNTPAKSTSGYEDLYRGGAR
ncbi:MULTISPECIES: hypothetical protein [Noviherbaspirillum]|jgi:uncharacterized lipoprotein YajG|nr:MULTISPECIES: hypothetical protein [Noviherbaspirillum]